MHWTSIASQPVIHREGFLLQAFTAEDNLVAGACPLHGRAQCVFIPLPGTGYRLPYHPSEKTFRELFLSLFFVSGFCSVLYELVWLRLAMAQFGVTTAMVSIVLSVFMAGLGLGSWASGEWLRRRGDGLGVPGLGVPALRLYALIELLIGVAGIAVPYELGWGRSVLERLDLASSLAYYSASGVWVACTLVPWCALMGATIPVGMRAIRQTLPADSARSFSSLYTANVSGAVIGTVLPLLLIELLGFRGTLRVGAACNAAIATAAMVLSRTGFSQIGLSPNSPAESAAEGSAVKLAIGALGAKAHAEKEGSIAALEALRHPKSRRGAILALLFLTGLTSMGMEVVWVRQFTPYLGTVVYAFASILCIYLAGTFVGSRIYRRWSSRRSGHFEESAELWSLLALAALLPLVTSSPSIHLFKDLRTVLGIAPFTGLLGFLTPMLVDRRSGGDPGKAGSAYAVNVLGCILGPLVAGFLLLPRLSERWSLIVLALPWLIFGLRAVRPGVRSTWPARSTAYAFLPVAGLMILSSKGYDESYPRQQVLRDSTATVIATGSGMNKQLLVNGYGMTVLTPITKMMAHLPLALLGRPPQDALDICFGMGTTFRSLLSWNIHTTAVELVPSVPRLFNYFHSNGAEVMRSPMGHVVIDDGRRYLERTTQQYDLITIDPPPPVEAAGSSMLYSEEFYAAARKRLRPGGILAQWLPAGDAEDFASVARALKDSFPYVRVFGSIDGWGYHFLASQQPLPHLSAEELLHRLPPDAVADLTEWESPAGDAAALVAFDTVLQREIPIEKLIAKSPGTPALRDDRPINEYYALRRRLRRWRGTRE
jgi:spermidine synthase